MTAPTIVLDTFIAAEVQKQYGSRCPVCGVYMTSGWVKGRGRTRARTVATVAHDLPAEKRNSVEQQRRWVYTCSTCNGDQETRTFAEHACHMKHFDMEKSRRLLEIARRIDAAQAERIRRYGE